MCEVFEVGILRIIYKGRGVKVLNYLAFLMANN